MPPARNLKQIWSYSLMASALWSSEKKRPTLFRAGLLIPRGINLIYASRYSATGGLPNELSRYFSKAIAVVRYAICANLVYGR